MARFRQFPAVRASERGARPPHKAHGQEQRTCLPPARAWDCWSRLVVQTGQAPVKGSRSREKVIVEVVTPIAVRDNAFGRLSSLQRPLRGGSC